MKKRVLFTFNSGGIGHATRSLSIAKYLREKNSEIDILFGGYGPGLEIVKMNGFKTYELPQPEYFPTENITLKKIIEPYYIHWKRYFKLFKEYKPYVHICDMELFSLIIGKIYAKHNILISHEFKPFIFKIGILKSFLRTLLIKMKDIIPEKVFYPWIEELGFSGKRKIVGPLAYEESAVKLKGKNKVLIVVSGAAKKTFENIDFSSMKRNITLYSRGVEINGVKQIPKCQNLFPYIKGVDLVICSGWSTIMEAFIARKPCLIIPGTEEQREVAYMCKRNNFADVATNENIEEKINELMFNKKIRMQLIRNESKLDNGAKEIADYINSLLKYK